jgi:hypothetical protein
MTLEFWHTLFQWGSVVLVALTFVFVAGALWTSNALAERHASRIQQLETAVTGARNALSGSPGRSADPRMIAPLPAIPRTLAATDRTLVLDTLRRLRPEGPLRISFVSSGGSEPAAFARVLADVIEEAGWPLTDEDAGGSTVGEPPVGLLVRIAERGEIPERAGVLQDALNRANLGARVERLASMREGAVELMVGLQP